ncbi:helix-turn-helix domain-containing protein [Mariniflexile sp.]|uniref:helix-turn-helix domain-containing protein n=1 Tax=Mariniflexile sp. TaxID=1979402 RepID=UPI004047BE6C
MSTNIYVQRICEYCKVEFTARTTKTQYCSHKCNSRHYKEKSKKANISKSNNETVEKITLEVQKIRMLDYLTVKEVSVLLRCSEKTVYRNIKNGNIKAINFGERNIRVKRSHIDELFKS